MSGLSTTFVPLGTDFIDRYSIGITTEAELVTVALSTSYIYDIDDYGVHTDLHHTAMLAHQGHLEAMQGRLAAGIGSTDARYLSIPAAIGVASSFLAVGIAETVTGIATHPFI